MTTSIPAAARAELTPTGKLRVGINHGNFLLVNKSSKPGEPTGVAPDLGRELAKRLGVPLAFVSYPGAGQLADSAKTGAWDVGFLGAEPLRAKEISFTAAYVEIEATYLVPAGSPIKTMADVDREGVRIAVSDKSAYDLYLRRNLKHAQLVRAEGIDASYQLFLKEKLEVLAGLRPRLVEDAVKNPGSRVLEGRFTAVQQAIGTPVGREAGAAYLRAFAEEIKTGLVTELISKHGVRGLTVAPRAAG